MRNPMRSIAVAAVVALAMGASSPAFASVADGIPPATVGLLSQSPAPGSGVRAATLDGPGGTFEVRVDVAAGDGTSAAPTLRSMSLTFPAGVKVTRLFRMVPGVPPAALPLPSGPSVTDTVMAPVTAVAAWDALVEVTETTPGTVLTTTGTAGTDVLAPVTVVTVDPDAVTCDATTTTLCVTAITGGIVTNSARTRVITKISSSVEGPADVAEWGDRNVHPTDAGFERSGAPQTPPQLDAYLAAWVAARKATLLPATYTAEVTGWDKLYAVDSAGTVYAQSALASLTYRFTAAIVVSAPVKVVVKAAPKPTLIRVVVPHIAR
jgi:hypothetical protein